MLLLWNDQVNTIAKHLSAYSGPEGYCGDVRAYCPPSVCSFVSCDVCHCEKSTFLVFSSPPPPLTRPVVVLCCAVCARR